MLLWVKTIARAFKSDYFTNIKATLLWVEIVDPWKSGLAR